MKRKLAFFVAALMILSGFAVLAGETEAWSSNFSTSDGWTIIGAKWAITGGELVGTALQRDTTQIAKHLFTDATTEEYNVTFDYKVTADQPSDIVKVMVNSVDMTDTEHNNWNKWLRLQHYGTEISFQSNETGTIQGGAGYSYTLNTWYTVNMRRINDNGTWKAQGRIWNNVTGSWGSTVLSESWTIPGARASMVGVFACNEDTNSAGYDVSVKIDDYEDHEGGGASIPDLEVTTLPLVTAIKDNAWYYNADCSQAESITWSLTGNITGWGNINSGTGNITGTPTQKGWFNAVVECENTTESVWQNFTVRVYDIWWGASNAIKNPLTGYTSAAYSDGHVFVGYLGDCGGSEPQHAWIVEYDGYNWSEPVEVGTDNDDDHGCPVVLVDELGYIHFFYGAHETSMKYKKSTNPLDISAWTTMSSPTGSDSTYPFALIDYTTDTMYFMYRKTIVSGSHYSWVYKTSTDHGTSWSAENVFVEDWDFGAQTYAPYVHLGTYPQDYAGDQILPFTWDAHNYTSAHRENIYFAYLNLSDGHCYSIAGQDMGTNISRSEGISYCLVYENETNKVWANDLNFDFDTFTPHIIFAMESGTWGYYYVTYNATSETWTIPVLIATLGQKGGRTAFQWSEGILMAYMQVSDLGVWRGGDMVSYKLVDGEWIGVNMFADRDQQAIASGSYFADASPVAGLDNDWIVLAESKDSDYSTELRIFVYNQTQGFLVNGTHVASSESSTWAPAFTSTPVTTGKVGVLYSYAAGCNESVTWDLSAGAFLSISVGGVISGTPDHAGTYLISIEATSVAGSNSTWQNYTLTVSAPYSGGTDPYDTPRDGGPDLDHPDWAARIAGFAVLLLILIMIAAGVKMATSRRKGGRGGRRKR